MNRGIIFMANDKSLISFAVMSVEYGQNDKDYFDMIIPFVLSVLKENKNLIGNNAISVNNINEQLKEEYGFILHHNVLEAIFRRMTNSKYGYLKTKNRNFYFTNKEIDTSDFQIKSVEARQHQNEVFSKFEEYLKSIPDFKYNKSEIEQKLIIYLNRYGFNVLSDQEIELILEDKEDINTYYIGKFISFIKVENETIFNYIKEIVKGAMLVSALYLQTDISSVKPDKEFEGLGVFFDTPLLMCALGHSGKELQNATMELINTINKMGVELYYFEHNIEELEGIFDAYITHYRNNTLDTSYNFEYLRLNDVTPTQAVTYKTRLKHDLEKCHLHQHKYSDDINIDIEMEPLDEYLKKNIYYRNPSRRKNDILSVLNVYHLRTRTDLKRIENCQFLFATSNLRLCSKVKKYFKEKCNRNDYPAIIDDTLLSSIVWLKTAKASDEIPTLKIISDAIASQMPPREFWDEFIKQINALNVDGKLDEREIFQLKYDSFIKNHIYEVTQGDTEKISYENLHESIRLSEYQKHKELIDDNNKKDSIISDQRQELIQEKKNKYAHSYFSKWKMLYYISKFGLLFICFIIICITFFIDTNIKTPVTQALAYSSPVLFVIAVAEKFIDKKLSKLVPTFDSYFLKKSYEVFKDSISSTDADYKNEIIKLMDETKYFKNLKDTN